MAAGGKPAQSPSGHHPEEPFSLLGVRLWLLIVFYGKRGISVRLALSRRQLKGKGLSLVNRLISCMRSFTVFSLNQQNLVDNSTTGKRTTVRQICVLLHRYVGLAIDFFLIIAGLTGSLLAFYHELAAVISPRLYRVQSPTPEAQPLDPFTLREQAEALVPGAWVHWAPLHREPDETIAFWVEGPIDPVTKEHAELENDEFFLNP